MLQNAIFKCNGYRINPMRKLFPVLAGCCLLITTLWLQLTTFKPAVYLISRLEDMAYDLQLQTRRLTHHLKQDSPVVIVDVDDRSIAELGRWPWPRSTLATLVDRLKANGAAVIAFDMIFPENQSNPANVVLTALEQQKLSSPPIIAALQQVMPVLENDHLFAKSLANFDAILGITFRPETESVGELPRSSIALPAGTLPEGLIALPGYLSNIPMLQKAAKSVGFINVFPDADGIVRRTPLLLRYKDNLYPSLALEAVRMFLLSTLNLKIENYYDQQHLEGIRIGNYTIPVDEKAQALIPYEGGSFYFPYYSAADVLHNRLPSDALGGKIVFVGTSATSLSDLRATAVQNIYPGVEIHATIASGILGKSFSSTPAWAKGAEISITIAVGLLCAFLFPFTGPRLLAFLVVALPALMFFANNWLWAKTGLLLSFLVPATCAVSIGIINILYGYFFESRTRERLRAMFGQYVPEKHITEMLSHPGEYTLYGEDRNMTVLFADIRNFTHISERLGADQLKDLLNSFFTPMTEIIFRHNGTIDKYVGDMIMAFWGAPLADAFHARNALLAALDMQKMVATLKQTFAERQWPDIKIGIGLNTGVMSVGDMGSHFRRNYTVLGDAVNLGSRVEGLTKFYGADILATKNTSEGQDGIIFRQVDRVRVKGKKIRIDIFEPLCTAAECPDALHEELRDYNAALACYFRQDWAGALSLFEALHSLHPAGRLYRLYIDRVKNYLETPPPANWDGIYTHTSK